jgi:glycosyltransferase involved in cell wall biosynthesis
VRALGFCGPAETISNGIDDERFHPGARQDGLRRRLRLDERPVVLYTGRLDAEKQMDVWLRAADALRHRIDVQFVVGGRGTELERLRRTARELGIEADVRFTGYLEDAEYPELYRIADVYFITSPVELQSICTLEATASGLPVVGVAAGALPELVRDAENGYCVEPGDWRAAAEALYRLASNPSLRASMGRASRLVAEQHTLGRSVERYERFLSRTANRGEQRIGHPAPAGG